MPINLLKDVGLLEPATGLQIGYAGPPRVLGPVGNKLGERLWRNKIKLCHGLKNTVSRLLQK